MNKVDICKENNESQEEIIGDLREKMMKVGVPIEDKIIYPISAKKQQEAIREDSQEKRKAAQFDGFVEGLSTYLTSEENMQDRLGNPLYAVEKRLEKEKQHLTEKLQACTQDQETLKKELKKRYEQIELAEKECKNKERQVQSGVRRIIKNAQMQFEQVMPEVQQEVQDELKDVTTEFDVEVTDFAGITIGI
jgi:uncharacterized protein (DUF3084 family)